MLPPENEQKKLFEWSDAQKRAYHRIKTGISYHKGKVLRFLTLGSIPEMKRDQQASFRVLKERIRRLTIKKLLDQGYISKRQLKIQYTGKSLDEKLDFHYLKIKTSEGPNGVLHILYFGDFLPQSWLKENWNEITGGCNSAYIVAAHKETYNETKLAKYCIVQYCIRQSGSNRKSKFLSYSWSPDWAYSGFIRDWQRFKREMRHEDTQLLYHRWKQWLDLLQKQRTPLPLDPKSLQHTLDGGVILWEW
jgi:hypothetical protein